MASIKCPMCRKTNTRMTQGQRERKRGNVRVRECKDCGYRFKTIEKYDLDSLKGVEPNGRI